MTNQTEALLLEALARMDRARDILTDGKPTPVCNWGMLATEDLRAALSSQPPAPRAPWPDFLGQPIHHGDRLTHPDGTEFVVVRLNGQQDEADAWRCIYDHAPQSVSRLGLQIGDKGRAVRASLTGTAGSTP